MLLLQEVEEIIQHIKEEVYEAIVNMKKEEDGPNEMEIEVVEKKPRQSLMESLLYDADDNDVEITDSYRRTRKERAEEEVNRYREMPKHKNAPVFWSYNKHTLPHLTKLASKYLVAQATSIAAERVFSTSGDIMSAERSCMNVDSLDAMIFLKNKKKKKKKTMFQSNLNSFVNAKL